MIYLDTSVALAQVLSESRRPPQTFWRQTMTSSQLLRYEIWNRLHAYGKSAYYHQKARDVLRKVQTVALADAIVVRALAPYPHANWVRTLDGLHLATMYYLSESGATVELASYDDRLIAVAGAMGFATVQP